MQRTENNFEGNQRFACIKKALQRIFSAEKEFFLINEIKRHSLRSQRHFRCIGNDNYVVLYRLLHKKESNKN